MKKKLPFLGALAFVALSMVFPAEAFEAAFQAMCTWATSFAPSLFPFFLLIPALTCREALAFYDRAFGRILPKLLAMPGRAASAVCVGLLAGSPAGAIATARVLAQGGFSKAEAKRLALITSGLSPMFLLSAVGVGLFRSRALGMIFLRSNLLSVLAVGVLCRFAFRDEENHIQPPIELPSGGNAGVGASVLQLASVCGYMVLFAVIARLIGALLGNPNIAAPVLGVLEIAGGLNALHGLPMSVPLRVALFSGLCSFGGICVMVQNRQKLSAVEIKPRVFCLVKLIHGALSALFAYVQLPLLSRPVNGAPPDPFAPLYMAASLALIVSVCVLFDLGKRRRKALP